MPPVVLTCTDMPSGARLNLSTPTGQLLPVLMADEAAIGAGAGPTFVFRPADPLGNHANVYTDWPTLAAAAAAFNGIKWIVIDGSLATATVPAGTWSVDQAVFVGSGPIASAQNVLHFADQAFFTANEFTLDGGARFDSASTSSVFTNTTIAAIIMRGTSGIQSSSGTAAPWLHVATGHNVQINLNDGAFIGGGANQPQITVDAGQSCFVFLDGNSRVFNNTVIGAGTLRLEYTDAAIVGLTQTVTTVTPTVLSLSSQVAYTPATPGNWQPAPTFANTALDQLAAPNQQAVSNAAQLGAAGTVTLATGNIQKARTGKVVISASFSGFASAAQEIQVNLLRDATVLPPLATAPTTAPVANNDWQASLSWIDTLPDTSAHTYSIQATTNGDGTVTIPIHQGMITVFEL